MVTEEVATFGQHVAGQLRILADNLLGVYFVGSVALGGYVANESDIDILAVTRDSISHGAKRSLAGCLLQSASHCPARGLEFNLYRREVLGRPAEGADFEVSVNGGPRMDPKVVFEPDTEPGFWYVLDRAIAHHSGITIVGPPACALVADIPRRRLLAAMTESMRWHRQNEKATLYSVLNASRGWRFAVENILGSKLEGAAWSLERWSNSAIINAAVELRHGRPANLDPGGVDEFVAHVEAVLTTST